MGQVGSILTGISQSIPVESPHTTLEPTRYSTSAIPFGKGRLGKFFLETLELSLSSLQILKKY